MRDRSRSVWWYKIEDEGGGVFRFWHRPATANRSVERSESCNVGPSGVFYMEMRRRGLATGPDWPLAPGAVMVLPCSPACLAAANQPVK